jgi:hypothetical protein
LTRHPADELGAAGPGQDDLESHSMSIFRSSPPPAEGSTNQGAPKAPGTDPGAQPPDAAPARKADAGLRAVARLAQLRAASLEAIRQQAELTGPAAQSLLQLAAGHSSPRSGGGAGPRRLGDHGDPHRFALPRDYTAESLARVEGLLARLLRSQETIARALSRPGGETPPPPPAEEVCRILTTSGMTSMDQSEYKALIDDHEALDLLVDLTGMTEDGAYQARVRKEDGAIRLVRLTTNEGWALADLARANTAVRATNVPSLKQAKVQNPDKVIESARNKIEGKGHRNRWRWILTVGGKTEKGFRFARETGRYAVLLPLDRW